MNLKSENRSLSAASMAAKCVVAAIPPSLLPDHYPSHPHLSFAVGLTTGFLLQNFVPPVNWRFLQLLILALVLIGLSFVFVR
jgi:hypothetical protein